MNSKKPYVDIAVVIALEEELKVFFDVFPSKENHSDDDTLLHEVNTDTKGITMVVIHQGDMGHAEAGQAVLAVFERYQVGLVICMGIAGGLSKDVCLGDVCYSERIIDVYENSKAIDADPEGSTLDIELSPLSYETFRKITRAFNFSRTQPDLRHIHEQWSAEQNSYIEQQKIKHVTGRDGRVEKLKAPSSRSGTIICGMVSKSKRYNERLQGLERRVLAVDTESGAVFRQAARCSTHALTVRGISDYADTNKAKLENDTEGLIRKIAVRSAVKFVKMQLRNPYFQKQLLNLRIGTQQQLIDLNFTPQLQKDDPLEEVSSKIDEQLRELSPEYRLFPNGYKVPAPRVQRHMNVLPELAQKYYPPVELRDALRAERKILISVPRSYPDRSLAWVFALDLLDAEIDNRQILPIVVDGSRISSPSAGLSKLASVNLEDILTNKGICPVIIVEDVPLQSKSRTKFLQDEVLRQEKVRFVFLSSSSPNILEENNFKLELSLAVYRLCDVSFTEISNFIQSSFEMSGSQAEVVAKRLWDTFENFDLSAHPTYFAGIPRQTLMALLHANRRAERV